jgi:hypothetical protein
VAHIRGVKGQSAAEFAVIMPLFLLAALGMAQLSLITTAAVMIKYTSYMAARVAVAADSRQEQKTASGEALLILNLMASKSLFGADIFPGLLDSGVDIENETMSGAKSAYIRVSVNYNFPLKVPFVNKIFGMFKGFGSPAAFIAGFVGEPYFPLRASCVMMVQ